MRLGTRGSRLALQQASSVKRSLEEEGLDVEVVEVETLGDRRDQWKSLEELDEDGLFTRELDAALIEEEVDLAVHSMKDVPTDLPDGVETAAVPPRESVRDVLIGKRLEELEPGDTVGTGSPRRKAQILRAVEGIEVQSIRGNVETRIGKVGDEVDAILLAEAGINRLELSEHVDQVLPLEGFLPAPGQGALAVSTREGSEEGEVVRSVLEDFETRVATTAERALLNELGTGCVEPIGALGRIDDGELVLEAGNYEEELFVEVRGSPEDADEMGRDAAESLE